MRGGSRLRGLPVLGFAAAGLVLGHLASYAIAFPDPHLRDAALEASGHAYFPGFAHVAVTLVMAGAATVVARGWLGSSRRPVPRFGALAALLATVQVTAFVGQEALEAALSGATPGSGRVLALGIVVQAVLALVGAAIASWLARASVRLAVVDAGGRTPWSPGTLVPLAVVPDGGPRGGGFVIHRGRAPPSA